MQNAWVQPVRKRQKASLGHRDPNCTPNPSSPICGQTQTRSVHLNKALDKSQGKVIVPCTPRPEGSICLHGVLLIKNTIGCCICEREHGLWSNTLLGQYSDVWYVLGLYRPCCVMALGPRVNYNLSWILRVSPRSSHSARFSLRSAAALGLPARSIRNATSGPLKTIKAGHRLCNNGPKASKYHHIATWTLWARKPRVHSSV